MKPVTNSDKSPRPGRIRADAARNLQRILTAAAEMYAERGLEVNLNQVAEHAGVGVGTVYRRYTNKRELIADVYEQDIRRLVEKAESALQHQDPWIGLVEFFEYSCGNIATNRGLGEVIRAGDDYSSITAALRERVEPAVDRVIDRARAAGVLRPGVEPVDFFILINIVDTVVDLTRSADPTAWHRYFEIMLDGLRADARPQHRLTTPALTPDQIRNTKFAGSG
ncbi:TetR/AcrR family transcriptional regulator [Nocardia sp. NBC_01499]|uniref:TetR/AcrR family transcriptional regulator n=1 Tax=Nocardia sp. NBC_01499 TaxID=2903597 RepID=UPI003864EA22